jgi:starch phosphorylase
VEAIKQSFLDNLLCIRSRTITRATLSDLYLALAYTVRDRVLHKAVDMVRNRIRGDTKIVCYLSAEFLLGPHLANNLLNLGLEGPVRRALAELGLCLEDILEQEPEPGLGTGGLGRLAACFLDSMATLGVPAIGYGIRYEFGIFNQVIQDGWQVEVTDKWLRLGNPWEIARPESALDIKLGGRTETWRDDRGQQRARWVPQHVIKAVPYDTIIPGYGAAGCNFLRLWKAEAVESFNVAAFNVGDYYHAVEEKVNSENISEILYPNDEQVQGKRLRLEQQFFLVSSTLQNLIRLHLSQGRRLDSFHQRFALQLNDTHPSLAVPEMMRLLVDEYQMAWEPAWEITREALSYTNHTLMAEALEKWPVDLLGGVLPRHVEIIFEINRRFLEEVAAKYPGDGARAARMSLIDESPPRSIRMAHLACVGTHAVNGVSELHTELLKAHLLADFHQLWPDKISNKTNGVTPRRFLLLSNPRLAGLITSRIGKEWVTNLDLLRKLEPLAESAEFAAAWQRVKHENKRELADLIRRRAGVEVDPASMFDVQVKRLHEYKRQHLNALHIITLYNRIRRDPKMDVVPRTFLFGGKAAPGYYLAKLMIKLIHCLADVVNRDADVAGRLKVAFFPDFNVTNGQWIYPAADLSEQISTAGKEASGTGNMKFALNGAVTIGTLDGANVEIRQEVGEDNFFLFGLTAPQVTERKARGYRPSEVLAGDEELRASIDAIGSGRLSRGDRGLFAPLVEALLGRDDYMVLADYRSYVDCQEAVSAAFRDQARWTRMSILNTARVGKFSSDRTIREYCRDIWHVTGNGG